MSRMLMGGVVLAIALSVGLASLPAQASEVVKLTKLVVSGKRSTNEATRTAPAERRALGAGSQVPGGSGNDAGTAPVPARGVS